MCREEAQTLSSLLPQLNEANIKLYAVVHEKYGVKEFQPFFKGEIFLDAERRFYGPKERWMLLSALLRPTVWMSMFRARGVEGNMKGEGRLLGGVFLVGPREAGVVFEHRESEFGDHANTTEILESIRALSSKL